MSGHLGTIIYLIHLESGTLQVLQFGGPPVIANLACE